MPIGGFVITCASGQREAAVARLEGQPGVEVHGVDEQGHIVVVMDTTTSADMDDIVFGLQRDPLFLNVGLVYLHAEDEADAIRRGELDPGSPLASRRKKKNAD